MVICDKCENPLPSFPAWEGVLPTKTGDPGVTDGWDKAEEMFEGVIKSTIDSDLDALPC